MQPQLRVRPTVAPLLATLTALVAVLTAGVACQSNGDSEHATTPLLSETVAGAPAHGLLIVREDGLALRAMPDGPESMLRRTDGSTGYVAYPRWSPDGTRIAYALTQPGTGADLVVSAGDGTEPGTVWKHQTPGESIEGLAWSPDGVAIYLSVLTPQSRDGRFTGSALRLLRLDLASGALTPIADDAAYPDVSPDGSRIAFVTFSSGSGPAGIWTVAPDGSDRRLVVPVPETFAGVRWPRFSPDGARIAFGAVEGPAANDTPLPCDRRTRLPWQPPTAAAHGPPIDIWSVPATGGTPERLLDLREDDPYLAWSPDGSAVAVIGACGLYLIAAAGGAAQRIADGTPRSQIDWR